MKIQGTKSALLAAAAFALSLAVDAETLYSDGAVLSLAEHNGAVEFMRAAHETPHSRRTKRHEKVQKVQEV